MLASWGGGDVHEREDVRLGRAREKVEDFREGIEAGAGESGTGVLDLLASLSLSLRKMARNDIRTGVGR
jgi:hypothetical protein